MNNDSEETTVNQIVQNVNPLTPSPAPPPAPSPKPKVKDKNTLFKSEKKAPQQYRNNDRELIKRCDDYKRDDVYWQESGKAVFKLSVDQKGYVLRSQFVAAKSTIINRKLINFVKGCTMLYRYEPDEEAAPIIQREVTIKLGYS